MNCPGTNCSKRDTCVNHFADGQVIDESRHGWHAEGRDKDGNSIVVGEINCGDNGTQGYKYYKNSEGTICAEECLHCPHKNLCFQILELAGMVFKPGDRVRFDCEEIKSDSEGRQHDYEHKLNLRKQGEY